MMVGESVMHHWRCCTRGDAPEMMHQMWCTRSDAPCKPKGRWYTPTRVECFPDLLWIFALVWVFSTFALQCKVYMSKINFIWFALSQDDLEVMSMRQCRKCRQFNTIWRDVSSVVMWWCGDADNANNSDNTENTIQYGIRDACSTADIRDYHKAWSMYVHTQGVWIFNYLSHRIVIYQICK